MSVDKITFDKPIRGRIYDSILETIGNTPLVRLPTMAAEAGAQADLCVKCEFFNPISSVKDRIGVNMILDLENQGKVNKDTTLVEPTSGNTGIGLAFAAAARGYRLILTMPESMSIERRKMVALFGAELVLTPKEKGMGGAIAKANELLSEIDGSIMPSQFSNPSNPAIHRLTTAEEIWHDTGGDIDAVIAGVGTGGTFTGLAQVLKERKPDIKMIAVEPTASPVLSGGDPGPHMIQGIGAGFIPDNMSTEFMDEVIQVSNETAFETARAAATKEGIPVGISSGAAIHAALQVAARPEMKGKRVIVIAASTAERYLSTALFDGLGD